MPTIYLHICFFFNIIVLIFIGVVLLTVKIAPQLTDRKYHRAKVLLGCAPLATAITTILQLQAYEHISLFSAAILIAAAFQACFFTFIVLTLFRSSYVTIGNILRHLAPTFVFVIIYTVVCFIYGDPKVSSLSEFKLKPGLLLRTLFAGVYLLQIGIYTRLFWRERKIYIQKVDNYFADFSRLELSWGSRLFYQAAGIGLAVWLFVLFPSDKADAIISLLVPMFYLSFSIRFINFQYSLLSTAPAVSLQIPEEGSCYNNEQSSEMEKALIECDLYLKKGVVLADYALALNTSERKLDFQTLSAEKVKQEFCLIY